MGSAISRRIVICCPLMCTGLVSLKISSSANFSPFARLPIVCWSGGMSMERMTCQCHRLYPSAGTLLPPLPRLSTPPQNFRETLRHRSSSSSSMRRMIQKFDCFCNDSQVRCHVANTNKLPVGQFRFTACGFPSGGSSCHHSRLRLLEKCPLFVAVYNPMVHGTLGCI